MDLRLGRWQDVLADVECDALICDPPYSERTHLSDSAASRDPSTMPNPEKLGRAIGYAHWTTGDVEEFVRSWSPRTRGWFVALTDHGLVSSWERALDAAGRYVFAPLPFVAIGSRIRLAGDGPSTWTCWVVVARPRHLPYSKWGTLPGAYVLPAGYMERPMPVVGGKPLWIMERLVEDYSRKGDLVCDPCAGAGTTLRAAQICHRQSVGAEMDPETYTAAVARARSGYTPQLDFGA